MSKSKEFNTVLELAQSIASSWDPKMKWMWGEALLGYAMFRLDEFNNSELFTDFLTGYCDYYVQNPPRVDQSDTAAPGLITYAMAEKTGNPDYKALTHRVLYYIKNEPRLIEDSVNHLGNSPEGRLYPKSIWVDSLMMFSVFPSLYAKDKNDEEMLDIAARQPRIMAKYMMDPVDHLWYHSYWVKQQTHYPRKKLYWGRGNGWVVASLPMILENIGDHPERQTVIEIFQKTSQALLPYQRQDGTFETLLNKPGKTYRELSCTALIAAGWFAGYRQGLLSKEFFSAGQKAYNAVLAALEIRNGQLFMPEISGPTIPLPVFPYLGYKLVPRGKNWSFGVAALIFAALEFEKIGNVKRPD